MDKGRAFRLPVRAHQPKFRVAKCGLREAAQSIARRPMSPDVRKGLAAAFAGTIGGVAAESMRWPASASAGDIDRSGKEASFLRRRDAGCLSPQSGLDSGLFDLIPSMGIRSRVKRSGAFDLP